MKKISITLIVMALFFIVIIPARAADSDVIGIRQIRQESPVWCWAAVTEEIVEWRNGFSPSQCSLVSISLNMPPSFCCTGRQECLRTAGWSQILYLTQAITGKGGKYSYPLTSQEIVQLIKNNNAIAAQITSSPTTTHVVVISGVTKINDGTYLLWVNDPMANQTTIVDYSVFKLRWIDAMIFSRY